MDARTIIFCVIGVFSTIIGLIYWVIKSRDKLVYKDVFESELKRIEDCWETELKSLKKEMTLRFDNLEKMLRK